jgi:hypothetical protein
MPKLLSKSWLTQSIFQRYAHAAGYLSLLLSAKSLSIQIETACPSAFPQKTFLAGFETTDTGGAGRTQFHQLYHG